MNFLRKRCYNGGPKHKFQPRYSEEPLPIESLDVARASVSALKALLIRKRYVMDVCVWCGVAAFMGPEKEK